MWDGVLCFHYSRMRIANDTYHLRTYVPRTYVRTNVPTPPALCLGTPVPRQKSLQHIRSYRYFCGGECITSGVTVPHIFRKCSALRIRAVVNKFSLLYIVRVMEFSASITRSWALQTIRTTYVRTYHARTYVRTYLRSQHCVSALRCRDKKMQIALGSEVRRRRRVQNVSLLLYVHIRNTWTTTMMSLA